MKTVFSKTIHRLHKIGVIFDRKAEGFVFHHPVIAFFAMFVGMPVLILAMVSVGTLVIMFPISNWLGWC